MTTLKTPQLILRLLLAIGFIGMGINHFRARPAKAMAAIIPPHITRRVSASTLVRFTGVCEIAGGIGLLVPRLRLFAGGSLIVFLIAVWPANHFASQHPERFGKIAIPFWPRLIAQLASMGALAFASAKREQ